MVFDNNRFKAAAEATRTALSRVNDSISKISGNRGLLNLEKDMNSVSIKASKMQVAVGAAIGTISSKATAGAMGMINSLTFGPISQGFNEYEALLTKQLVIQNATGKSATEVKGVLSELNKYSDETIYSFGDMTSSITKFVNAGVPLDQAVKSIRGIANMAAYAGASTEEASRSMYAFSQSMSLGYIQYQDWMQIENANMGTQGFKKEILKSAEAMGMLRKYGKDYITRSGVLVNSTNKWKNSLQEQWATTNVLNDALSKYNKGAGELGDKAFLAATQVKTFSQFMSTLKEGIGSGWANVFTQVFGGLEDATSMWTSISNAVGGVVKAYFAFLEVSLKTWREMGGAVKIAQAFKNVIAPFVALFKAVGDAWKAAFPNTGKGAGGALYGISVAIELLTRPLMWLAKLISLLTKPLTLFFQVIHLGGVVIGSVIGKVVDFVKGLVDLVDFKAPSSGGMWDYIKKVASAISDAVAQATKLIEAGESIGGAFKKVDFSLPKMPDFGGFSLGGLFGGGGGDKEATKMETVSTAAMQMVASVKELGNTGGTVNLKQLTDNMDGLDVAVQNGTTNIKQLTDDMDGYIPTMEEASEKGQTLMDVIKGIGRWVGDLFSKITSEDIATSLNFAVLATMGLTIAKTMRSFSKMMDSFSDIAGGASELLGGAGDALKSFQTRAKAKLLIAIAIALGVLAAALWVLSKIPKDKLFTALKALTGAIAAMSVILIVFWKVVDKLDGDKMGRRVIALGLAMIGMGLGILLIAKAMKAMQEVGVAAIIKTLLVTQVIFWNLIILGDLAEKSGRKMIAAATSMVIISVALALLAGAIRLFQFVDPVQMIKAGIALAAMTGALFLLGKVPASALFAAGLAIVATAFALNIIVVALLALALVKWESIAKAAVILGVLALSLALMMITGGPTGAAAIVAMAGALVLIAIGCLMLQKVNWETIGKAAAVLGLLIVAFALFMGVVYLAAPAIAVLVPLAVGLGLLAVGIALLVTAFTVALPLLAAGTAAFAVFAAGAAVAIAVFLQTLALEAPNMKKSAIVILQNFVDGVVESVPIIIDGIKRVIKAIRDQFTSPESKAKIATSGDGLLQKLKDKLREFGKKLIEIAIEWIEALAEGLQGNMQPITEAVVEIALSLLRGLASKADDLVELAGYLIGQLIIGLGKALGKLVEAGVDLIINFINSLAKTIDSRAGGFGEAIANLIASFRTLGLECMNGIIKGMTGIDLKAALQPILDKLPGWAKKILRIESPSKVFMEIGKFLALGMAKGIQDHAAAAIVATASMVSGQIATASSYISKYIQDLDQKAIAARAKADGLALAAERASDLASKTKTTVDDDQAKALKEKADREQEKADEATEKAEKAKERADRKDQYKDATNIEKAKMKSEDAQAALDDAKEYEEKAAKNLQAAKELEKAAKGKGGMSESERKKLQAEANSLRKQAEALKDSKAVHQDWTPKGETTGGSDNSKKRAELEKRAKEIEAKIGPAQLTDAERKKILKEADELRDKAEEQAKAANAAREEAKKLAGEALTYQKKAGEEAAKSFEAEYKAQAAEEARAEAFEKMTDADKAATRREEAAALQKKADDNLAKAKKLAYTDLDKANELAQQAMDQAAQARDYLREAEDYDQAVRDKEKEEADKKAGAGTSIPITGTTNLDLTASDAAAAAFQQYTDTYSQSVAAAAAGNTFEFKQYNTSPESLSPTEIYRQTNNLLTQAADKLGAAA
jgi:tape measure domain-containing protein